MRKLITSFVLAESLRRAKELNARKTHLLLREVDIIEKQKKAKMISELLEWRESFQQRMKKSSLSLNCVCVCVCCDNLGDYRIAVSHH